MMDLRSIVGHYFEARAQLVRGPGQEEEEGGIMGGGWYGEGGMSSPPSSPSLLECRPLQASISLDRTAAEGSFSRWLPETAPRSVPSSSSTMAATAPSSVSSASLPATPPPGHAVTTIRGRRVVALPPPTPPTPDLLPLTSPLETMIRRVIRNSHHQEGPSPDGKGTARRRPPPTAAPTVPPQRRTSHHHWRSSALVHAGTEAKGGGGRGRRSRSGTLMGVRPVSLNLPKRERGVTSPSAGSRPNSTASSVRSRSRGRRPPLSPSSNNITTTNPIVKHSPARHRRPWPRKPTPRPTFLNLFLRNLPGIALPPSNPPLPPRHQGGPTSPSSSPLPPPTKSVPDHTHTTRGPDHSFCFICSQRHGAHPHPDQGNHQLDHLTSAPYVDWTKQPYIQLIAFDDLLLPFEP